MGSFTTKFPMSLCLRGLVTISTVAASGLTPLRAPPMFHPHSLAVQQGRSAVNALQSRANSPAMLFPQDGLPRPADRPTPQSRNAEMAKLLGALTAATSAEVSSLLEEATPMLVAPFFGEPSPGSVYGNASSSLEERVAAYSVAMEERIATTRDAGRERQASALLAMYRHVLAALDDETASASDSERQAEGRRRHRSSEPRACDGTADETLEQPTGIHPGVLCDKSLNPIVGFRYTDGNGYDLCQTEYDKLASSERGRFTRLAPPLTPRRALAALMTVSATATLAGLLLSAEQPRPPSDEDYEARYDLYDDYAELPELTLAEKLVAYIFHPVVPARVGGGGARHPAAEAGLLAR